MCVKGKKLKVNYCLWDLKEIGVNPIVIAGWISRPLVIQLLWWLGETLKPNYRTKPQSIARWGRESSHCCIAIRSSWPGMRSTGPSAESPHVTLKSHISFLPNNVLGTILALFVALLATYYYDKQFSFQPLFQSPVYINSLMTTCGILSFHNSFTYLCHLKTCMYVQCVHKLE